MVVKILGTGCKKCTTLEERVKEVIKNNEIDSEVIKIQEPEEIMKYGIMMTPGLVINEKVVSYGEIPKNEDILKWLSEN